MRDLTILLALALALAGCAAPAVRAARHEAPLAEEVRAAPRGAAVARGPLTLLRVYYAPAAREGRAALWVSRDAACAPGAAPEALSAVEGWYGPLTLAPGEYLCARHAPASGPATLTWWAEPQSAALAEAR